MRPFLIEHLALPELLDLRQFRSAVEHALEAPVHALVERQAGSLASGCTLDKWGLTHLPYGQRDIKAATCQSHGNSSRTRDQSRSMKSSAGKESSSRTSASGMPSFMACFCALKCADAQPSVPKRLPMLCFFDKATCWAFVKL
eukprot:CAMPEP_0172678752 /NCGR_PEP_ID=MMETSP1074-20121228/15617_1 /TAXON_ID=2916 /ORGANISM="Ceratium fusus, Strain PA161109" /LENGTH=142 /DNA_ID=CAMNT_0013496841 /DNA_START=212 /DNA_END=641 /DNA_ORIENTATION=-